MGIAEHTRRQIRQTIVPASEAPPDMALPIQSNGTPLNVAHAMAQAVELHEQGQLSDSERLYSAILAA
jgi:hypothetical protein